MTATTIHAAGLVAVAGVFGAMAFFAFVYAPLVLARHRGRWMAVSALDAIPGCAFRRSRSPIPVPSRSPSPVKPITCRSEATRGFDYAVQ